MNFKEIQDIIKLINKTNLAEFKMKDGDFEMLIRTKKYLEAKSAPVAQAPQALVPVSQATAPIQSAFQASAPAAATDNPAPAASNEGETADNTASDTPSNTLEVRSPMVGTFYRSPSPEKGPYIKVGDEIQVGDVVCIVEAMKLFNEIETEVSGKIVKVMVEDAQPVEYDQVLFLVEPS
jgi:acetyl-CoA carboxylase biotin carboxyl carrier protein